MEMGTTEKEKGEQDKDKKEEEGEEDQHQQQQNDNGSNNLGFAGLPVGADKLDPTQLLELRQHELFLSRIVETMPVTQIRGKCAVVILNEVETCDLYLGHEVSAPSFITGNF